MLKVVHSTAEPSRPMSDRERWAMQVLRETYTPAEIMELQANLTGHDLDILARAAHRGAPPTVELAIAILWRRSAAREILKRQKKCLLTA